MSTFVFLDLEATGLPSAEPEIAELSLFAVHRSSLENPERNELGIPVLPRVLDKLTLCMSPTRPFTAKASEITGLSSEGLARSRKAGFDGAVVRTLQAFLSRQEGPICLVAHNGFDYDFPLLCHGTPSAWDTLPALRGLDRAHSHGTRAQGRKGYSLGSLFRRYFGAEPSAAHSAEGDVHTLLMVFLHRAAELLSWADEQARSWLHIQPMYTPPDSLCGACASLPSPFPRFALASHDPGALSHPGPCMPQGNSLLPGFHPSPSFSINIMANYAPDPTLGARRPPG
uniref:exodeoxyribonuclease III n=1 Tax=Oryctolagus cuniculus TaxID=9986 RepID=A0A5F9CAJ6_RABIT